MRTLLLAVVAMATPLLAQDPGQADGLAATRQRLEKALQQAAALTDTAFGVNWGPDRKPKQQDNPIMMILGAQSTGEVRGSWHEGLDHVIFAGEQNDELLLAGRRMLARSKDEDWALRAGRFVDGNEVAFVPDVAALLRQLADWQLAITHREVGALDDRPVEIFSVTLNEDQVTQAAWGGLLPPTLVSGIHGNLIMNVVVGGAAGGRRPAARPNAIVDLAITLDPATGTLHLLQFRAYAVERANNNRVVIVGGNPVAASEEEEEEEIDENAPLQFVDGLPERPRKKKTVTDYTVRLRQHGAATPPSLTAAQKKLLGL